jgi:hypothetical protein
VKPKDPHPNEDKHKAPTHPRIHPLSLQDGGERFLSFPDSVVNIHQDGGERFLSFPDSVVKRSFATLKVILLSTAHL